jgi:hypothetical protein
MLLNLKVNQLAAAAALGSTQQVHIYKKKFDIIKQLAFFCTLLKVVSLTKAYHL